MSNYHYYENFNISGISSTSLEVIVIGVAIGLAIAIITSTLYKVNGYRIVKALLDKEAIYRENAVSLDELNLKKGKMYISRSLSKGTSPLRKLIYVANEDEIEYKAPSKLKRFWYTKFLGMDTPVNLPVKEAKFYIPEERKDAAELRFAKVRRPVFTTVISLIATAVAAVFILKAVPYLLSLLDSLITQYSGNSKFY